MFYYMQLITFRSVHVAPHTYSLSFLSDILLFSLLFARTGASKVGKERSKAIEMKWNETKR